MAGDAPLWVPTKDQVDAAPMTAFMQAAAAATGKFFSSYADLHRWSIDDREAFWSLVWDFCGIVGDKGANGGASGGVSGGERVLVDGEKMPGAAFFPDARLNFAENLLKKTGLADAIVFRGEDKVERAALLGRAACADLAAAAAFPVARGEKGRPHRRDDAQHAGDGRGNAGDSLDRRRLVVLLARFRRAGRAGPVRPDRAGRVHRPRRLLVQRQGRSRLPTRSRPLRQSSPTVRKILIVDYLGTSTDVAATIEKATALDEALSSLAARPVTFERLPFAHPLYILFSSGTTGIPKCIVHSAGGTLLQHVKEATAARRPARRRPLLLFHHLRLDDVELAGLRPGVGRNASAL